MGLLCAHIIQDQHYQKENIHLSDVNSYYYFTHPDPTDLEAVELRPYLVYELLIMKPKGRPSGSRKKPKPASLTTRNLLFFELLT